MTVPWAESPGEGVSLRLLLLRHGEPEPDSRGRCYGKLDVALSSGGQDQARRMATVLAGAGITGVYASPRIRTLDTAVPFCAQQGLPVHLDPRLAELDFGILEGLTYAEVEAQHPELFAAWMRNPTEVQFPQGERHADMRARVASALEALRFRHPGEVVLVVTHGGVVRTLVAQMLGLEPRNMFRLGHDYAGLTCVDFFGDAPVVRASNWQPAG